MNRVTTGRQLQPSAQATLKGRGIKIQKPETARSPVPESIPVALEKTSLNLFFKLLLLMTYLFSAISLYLAFQPQSV